jgi:hypothetical protein
MTRTIEMGDSTPYESFDIARLEDVDYDEMKKKWMDNSKNFELSQDNRTVEEIQADEDFQVASLFVDFFEMGDEIELDPLTADGLEAMSKISAMMGEGSQEVFDTAEMQRALNIEEDAAERIEQVETFIINDDDPFLSKEYKEKSERIIQRLMSGAENRRDSTETIFESSKENTRSYYDSKDTEDIFGRKTSSDGYRTATATNTTTTSSQTVHDEEKRRKEIHQMFAAGNDKMLNFVYNGPVKKKENRSPINKYGGKRKFGIKSIWASTKHFFGSRDAKVLCKVGIALCLETALAIITKQREFNGPGQMLGYLGMMLGVFYIGSEIRAEGYDMRRLSVI